MLRGAIAKAVGSAFRALGDVVEQVTLTHYTGNPVRNMTTGAYTAPSTDYTGSVAVITNLTEENRANVPDATILFILQQSEFPEVSIGDVILRNSVSYEVLKPEQDPAQVTHTLYCKSRAKAIS